MKFEFCIYLIILFDNKQVYIFIFIVINITKIALSKIN